MHALLLIHLPYTILHISSFMAGAFDDECTSTFGTKILLLLNVQQIP